MDVDGFGRICGWADGYLETRICLHTTPTQLFWYHISTISTIKQSHQTDTWAKGKAKRLEHDIAKAQLSQTAGKPRFSRKPRSKHPWTPNLSSYPLIQLEDRIIITIFGKWSGLGTEVDGTHWRLAWDGDGRWRAMALSHSKGESAAIMLCQ